MGCLGLFVSGTTRLLTPNTDGAPFCVRTLDWPSAQYDFLYFDGCTPSDTYWLTLITQAFWYPFWLLAFGVHPVPLYHNSDVESGGSCGTILWCISLCGLPFARCLCSLILIQMLCTFYDQDAMHFIWFRFSFTLIRSTYLNDSYIYCLPTFVSDDATLGA